MSYWKSVSLFTRVNEILFLLILPIMVKGQDGETTVIKGQLSLDKSWEVKIYLSHIPSLDDMYTMSNDMIIAETQIDSLGFFEFKLNFLPEGDNLYRLHTVKKGDTKATLIIGGKDENHGFIIVNHPDQIELRCTSMHPPFKDIEFENSTINNTFQAVSQLVNYADSISNNSLSAKRNLVRQQLRSDLLTIADSSKHFLVGLFSLYKSNIESNYINSPENYHKFKRKWMNQDNLYFEKYAQKVPNGKVFRSDLLGITLVVLLGAFASLYFKFKNGVTRKLKSLSIQERKVFDLLQDGKSNQEIANQLNICLSTVKTHVSSVYTKLKIKSRKEVSYIKT